MEASFPLSRNRVWHVSWGHGGFDDIWGENHFFKNLFSNGMTWNGKVMAMDILAADAYSEMELSMPI
jgi:hypothetical protein